MCVPYGQLAQSAIVQPGVAKAITWGADSRDVEEALEIQESMRRSEMIRRSEERTIAFREEMRAGQGIVKIVSLLNGAEEMYGKGRLFSHFTLEPGCSIGFHVHEGESETYYILRGTGEYNDNGTLEVVQAGDVAFAADGEGHAIKNIRDEPLEFIGLILYK